MLISFSFLMSTMHLATLRVGFPLLQHWLPGSKSWCFSAKFDRCTGRTQRSDGSRRYKLASMKFNAFAGGRFLRLPRSHGVAEKSSQIRSREPNHANFQQNPIVMIAELNAPMDPGAINAQAWSSTHLLGVDFSVCRDRITLRRNPIRPLASQDPIGRRKS